jgi:tetratricopeptide (TPR) repeat protein
MSVRTPNNFFIDVSLKFQAEFYQRLFKRVSSFKELGNELIRIAEYQQAFRRYDVVNEVAQILINLPLENYKTIGQYYLGLCEYRTGIDPIDIFEHVAETAPSKYRVLAMHSLAAIGTRKEDHDFQLFWLLESLKIAPSIQAFRGVAILKAIEGNHRAAIKDFEKYLHLSRYAEPLVYYDFLNSYAVELGEAGRKDEARNIIKHVLASPFASAYPEWQDTARDLREPNRSFVAFPFVESKFVKIEPAAHPSSIETQPEPPTKVLAFPAPDSPFQPLKEAPRPKKPKRVTSKELGEMNMDQKREAILAAIRSGAVPDRDYNKMMFMLGMVKSGPADHLIDLEDDAVLTELVMQWAHMIEPERIAAVMSALRDCKDDLRRSNILDSIIRKAFEYSNRCNVTESEWRLEVECKLPEK